MYVDMLGRPIQIGDTVAFSINSGDPDQGPEIMIAKVESFASPSGGKSCIRVDSTMCSLRYAHNVLVITREIEYTKEHHPELLL